MKRSITSPSNTGDHMKKLVSSLTFTAVLASAMSFTVAAHAQTYPEKPIRLVVPFTPGSGTDTVARLLAEPLGAALEQSVIVENKPGGNGTIAAGNVARAEKDGYTILVTTNTSHSAAPSLMKRVPYDPVEDFTSISRLVNFPFVLVVNAELPVNSVDELIAYGRDNPKEMSYASGNSTGIVAGATFQSMSGIEMIHVPYKSTPQALTDVIGGRVPVMFVDVGTGLPHIQSGKVRALAVTTPSPTPLLPEVPTLGSHETFKGFEIFSWNALSAPAGTPDEVIKVLSTEVVKIVESEAFRKRLATMGIDPVSSTPAEQTEFLKRDIENWARMSAAAGIEPQ